VSGSVLADTGPLYAAIAPRDAYYTRARSELEELIASRWDVVAVEPTVCEAYTLIMQRLGITFAHRWLNELSMGTVLLIPTAEDYRLARSLVMRYPDQDLTLFDALVAIISQRTGFPVWTYDHHFDVLRVPVWRV
jgi:predicted nucleic acid-binding protein